MAPEVRYDPPFPKTNFVKSVYARIEGFEWFQKADG